MTILTKVKFSYANFLTFITLKFILHVKSSYMLRNLELECEKRETYSWKMRAHRLPNRQIIIRKKHTSTFVCYTCFIAVWTLLIWQWTSPPHLSRRWSRPDISRLCCYTLKKTLLNHMYMQNKLSLANHVKKIMIKLLQDSKS